MSLIFPTQLPFPLYPVRPTAEDEASSSAFFQALSEFFRHLLQQHTSTRRYFQAAEFQLTSSNQEGQVRTSSADVTQEAISFVIQNITQPVKGEYVWDASQNCWVLKLTPV